jgi:hypothetical protein
MPKKRNILLVEPGFPFPNKSKNKANSVHKNFVPIGLLKFGAMHKSKGNRVKLVRGEKTKKEVGFVPDEILVTSIFTYWSNYVWTSIEHYRQLFPKSKIRLGGIYATLHHDTSKFKNLARKFNVEVSTGVNYEAEKYIPDYSLIPNIDYHATHMMRGCIRHCPFCGTWKIEPQRTNKSKEEIIEELQKVGKNKVIFYDNNLLSNPYIKDILNEFSKLKINGKSVIFESQSGFDGRLLEKDPELACLIRKARFQNARIAWDNSLKDKDSLKKQINILTKAGYNSKDISIFMIYNFDTPYEDMMMKIKYCKRWGVQITDCRYRPLDIDYDGYNPHLREGQPKGSFYIHKKSDWDDYKIRSFRSSVRKHNIWVRYARDKGLEYDPKMERWSSLNNTYKFFKIGKAPLMKEIEKSPTLQDYIRTLNKLKNDYKLTNVQPPDLSSYSKKELRCFIDKNAI